MSKFLKALDQAQRDRALLEQAVDASVTAAPGAPRATTATRPADPAVLPPAPSVAPPPRLVSPPAAPPVVPANDGGPIGGGEVAPHLVSLVAPVSFEAEQYRTLRHIVEQAHRSGDLRVLAVSASAVGDGKTTTAINLAGALAQTPAARVLLVDADLRHPAIINTLGLRHSNLPGLVDATLEPTIGLDQVARFLPRFNLSVVVAGRAPSSPYEILKSPRLAELFHHARSQYDYIVVDTPPLVALPDCRILAKYVDGFLLVVTAHKTPRRLLEAALAALEPSKIVGIVFNGDDEPPADYTGYVGTSTARGGAGRRFRRAVA